MIGCQSDAARVRSDYCATSIGRRGLCCKAHVDVAGSLANYGDELIAKVKMAPARM